MNSELCMDNHAYLEMPTVQLLSVAPRLLLRLQHLADVLIQSILHKCFVVSSKTYPHASANGSWSKNTIKLTPC